MTAQDAHLLIGAVVGALGAVQVWLVNQSVTHGQRITANEQAIAQQPTVTPVSPATQSRINAYQAEIDRLRKQDSQVEQSSDH